MAGEQKQFSIDSQQKQSCSEAIRENYDLIKKIFRFVMKRVNTALRNHMRMVFEEMTSWTALTMYLGMKSIF